MLTNTLSGVMKVSFCALRKTFWQAKQCKVGKAKGHGSHEGLILYLKENVLAIQARQGKEGMGQGGHEGLILYLNENVLARERV